MSSQSDKSVYYIPKGSAVGADIFDVRVVDRNISAGRVEPKEYAQHLADLPDSTSYAQVLPYEDVVDTETVDSEDDGISDEDLSF